MDELAIRDGLTGLYLNRYFQERLNEEIQRAMYGKTEFSLLLLDIDFFKRFNDEYGHAAGDIVLKSTASLIQHALEPGDMVARYGGEEFVALLPGKTGKQALAVAEKIRKQIEKHKITLRRGETHLTASLGISAFPDKGRTKEELLWAADQCLYKAKNSGRNRVVG
jgi:diguanylate cyclase (GGDEF)-like protein